MAFARMKLPIVLLGEEVLRNEAEFSKKQAFDFFVRRTQPVRLPQLIHCRKVLAQGKEN